METIAVSRTFQDTDAPTRTMSTPGTAEVLITYLRYSEANLD